MSPQLRDAIVVAMAEVRATRNRHQRLLDAARRDNASIVAKTIYVERLEADRRYLETLRYIWHAAKENA